MPLPFQILAWGATDIGRRRSSNEDAFGIFPELGLYLVVDGAGGDPGGAIAARIAVETAQTFFEETQREPDRTWPVELDFARTYEENRLCAALQLVNERIFLTARSERKMRGTHATCVAVSFVDNWIYLAHVGDCCIYRLRGNRLEQLTEDHTRANELLRNGQIKPEDMDGLLQMRVNLLRALGWVSRIDVDIRVEEAVSGDIYLLCTRGLSGVLPEPEIEAILQTDAEHVVARLIERANENGGPVNVTCVVARVTR